MQNQVRLCQLTASVVTVLKRSIVSNVADMTPQFEISTCRLPGDLRIGQTPRDSMVHQFLENDSLISQLILRTVNQGHRPLTGLAQKQLDKVSLVL